MRFLLLSFLFLTSVLTANAQLFDQQDSKILNPVKWTAEVEQRNDSIYDLVFTAKMESGWHLYSQEEVAAGGPLPTEFNFNAEEGNYELIGETREPDGVALFDPVFEMNIKYFEDEVEFGQTIKVKPEALPTVEASVFFMVCDEEQCLAPETVPFTLSLAAGRALETVSKVEISEEDHAKTAALNINVKGAAGVELEEEEEAGYMSLFFLGFIGGLIALLTPCVFPMIPLTVSFFTKGARTKKRGLVNAIMYGVFIFFIYLLLSLPFHLLDSVNPEILNNISTNVTLNIIFFVIFIFFAFSFFGYYEITLPSSWSNKMDDKASSFGGILGVFFMALTLAIVSFSCTGPILGSLLGSSLTTDGGAMQLSFGMGGFGLALALPFALFALFPNWLNSLPKSGGWLNSVKVVLGFIELALAFKFLSNADLVQHWGILKREIFIGIWVIVGIGLLLYLFGIIRFPHDGPKTKLSKGRLFLGFITLAFVAYLIPGLSNTHHANLKLLSGFPPPLFYSIYEKETEGPLGLKAYKDFEQGVAAAKVQNKPILLDFTGWACVNCRKMEEQVWSDPAVFDVMQDEFILISLYVDDREQLPEAEQFNYVRPNGTVKEIRTVGDKWATFQTLNFRNNSQPFYVLMDSEMNLLNKPVGYTPDADKFLDWLSEGVKQFNR
ncbi:thiol:disulfide interchange protein DsbD [Salinimicrobium catena]|uniref:Thiol:disulfide interchange protein DsbD n=1 Tax=Salinimicrobium catena TaxID=390640 RepID=A0A1H5LDA0_9FLAO|nr:thioredoxin family protein [Salinimicrobium catena]SDL08267.1 thiol:disulfide interchange protein DsbD [Salinimicrobium catena]SEE74547.1 thiol:disulfide interchange protein DsbD [Salinimicrobium catena]